jgi:hypothetical protein
LFTAKLMDLCKSWPLPTIAASPVIGWLGFNWLIDPTFAGHRQRYPSRPAFIAVGALQQ